MARSSTGTSSKGGPNDPRRVPTPPLHYGCADSRLAGAQLQARLRHVCASVATSPGRGGPPSWETGEPAASLPSQGDPMTVHAGAGVADDVVLGDGTTVW